MGTEGQRRSGRMWSGGVKRYDGIGSGKREWGKGAKEMKQKTERKEKKKLKNNLKERER